MVRNPLLIVALAITALIAGWGILAPQELASFASTTVALLFKSRAWFIMLTVSMFLLVCLWLAFSKYGQIRLGRDDESPEFSTISWLCMLFAAGMGVGLLYWGAAEPITHYLLAKEYVAQHEAANLALFLTNFHWGFHAWAIYAVTALAMAYFGFRKGCPYLLSAPILYTFGRHRWTRAVGAISDLLAIVAIGIGLGGSVAMGVFQVQGGIESLFDFRADGRWLSMTVFAVLCAAFLAPLMVDLGKGMSLLSNTAMSIAAGLVVFILLAGPTYFLMSGIVETFGTYLSGFIQQGFTTYTFFDSRVGDWFGSWTLTYMVWWLAWAPFVGVFIARISKGRTIREFIFGVVLVPTAFSVVWFGVFGGMGFFSALENGGGIVEVVRTKVSETTFFLLESLPLSGITITAMVVAAFLFLVTSVVSAAFVLGMFSTRGDLNPNVRVKLAWGVVLGALGLAMILSDSIDAVKAIIALGAMPFVPIVLLLMVCLLKTLRKEFD